MLEKKIKQADISFYDVFSQRAAEFHDIFIGHIAPFLTAYETRQVSFTQRFFKSACNIQNKQSQALFQELLSLIAECSQLLTRAKEQQKRNLKHWPHSLASKLHALCLGYNQLYQGIAKPLNNQLIEQLANDSLSPNSSLSSSITNGEDFLKSLLTLPARLSLAELLLQAVHDVLQTNAVNQAAPLMIGGALRQRLKAVLEQAAALLDSSHERRKHATASHYLSF